MPASGEVLPGLAGKRAQQDAKPKRGRRGGRVSCNSPPPPKASQPQHHRKYTSAGEADSIACKETRHSDDIPPDRFFSAAPRALKPPGAYQDGFYQAAQYPGLQEARMYFYLPLLC